MSQATDFDREITELYRTDADAMRRYCYLKVRDTEIATQLTHDVFCRLLETDSRIEHLRGYAWQSLRNAIIDWVRKEHRYTPVPLYNGENRPDSRPVAIHVEARVDLELVLRRSGLNERELHCIYLHHIHGLDRNQIAERLGASPKANAAVINRGMAKLRRMAKIQMEEP